MQPRCQPPNEQRHTAAIIFAVRCALTLELRCFLHTVQNSNWHSNPPPGRHENEKTDRRVRPVFLGGVGRSRCCALDSDLRLKRVEGVMGALLLRHELGLDEVANLGGEVFDVGVVLLAVVLSL